MQLLNLAIIATTLLAATARADSSSTTEVSSVSLFSSPVSFVPVKRAIATANYGLDEMDADNFEDFTHYEGAGQLVKRGRAASRGKGRGTFFTPSDDACTGRTSSKKDFIVAMNEADFGQPKGKDTEDAKNCNKCLEVRYKKKKIIVKVTDLCPKRFCSKGALDFAPGAFKALEPNLKLGVIKVSWKVLKNCNKWKKRG